ncbi:MAG: hypothetical protein J6V99_00025, partial [Neisseriaceae bacterium]|nr:hypothetical protein [Neisseriaceae bacterium]
MENRMASNAINATIVDGVLRLNPAKLWRLYSEQKQTKTELAERFKCSHSTITRYLKKHIKNNNFPEPKNVI